VLPGGRDVNPVRYNQIPGFWTGPSDPFLEYFDEVMLPKYIDKNIPIFGICRGMQSLAVHFGLPLMQHIDGYHEKSVKNRGELVHDLYTFNDRTAKGTFKKDDIICKTNSLHHQGVNVTDMIESDSGLKPLAITDNWVVESFVHSEKKIAGVQYHPEEIYDEHSQKIITSLLND
jgi:putative glutamine amidotransferase